MLEVAHHIATIWLQLVLFLSTIRKRYRHINKRLGSASPFSIYVVKQVIARIWQRIGNLSGITIEDFRPILSR